MKNFTKQKSKVHLLFEQSGTFKKAFKSFGFQAFDYDINDNFKQTDFQMNLFEVLTNAAHGGETIFDDFSKDDLLFAFFPCTFFTDQSQLISRGDAHGCEGWSDFRKLQESRENMRQRATYYNALCRLCECVIVQGLRLIIENPAGKCNFLKQYFPIKPAVILQDRRLYGDYYKKPTQFFFINCEPSFNLERINEFKKNASNPIEKHHGFERSLITQEFAENFIKTWIL